MTQAEHVSVLLAESVSALSVRADGSYLDGTFGRGGHSREILSRLSPSGKLIAVDKDPAAEASALSLANDPRFQFEPGSFADISRIVTDNSLDGILLDLGVSSPQLDDAQRGFGFSGDGPLDMRMDTRTGMTAAQWLASAPEQDIADVIKTYGEERFGKRMAAAIVKARAETPITGTRQLANIIAEANPKWEPHKHPATRAFQAIRIFINRELEDLELALECMVDKLVVGGRLVVISFHSLEDRIVKRFMRDQARGIQLPRHVPVVDSDAGKTLNLVGKAMKPSNEEIARNPRSRSAVMRIAERR
ncbi:MAG: 16S rRNA (cytosine(1402)-N(4))-methyltransferase RsmH [Luminiphilus sp.]|uniref:Ribosomal RNA small subunit methyltransferase H n=1 Tax=Candidatus Paraluminiphilus aquimaris TaxID=2518994 RepID=A0ABY6Q924_9GAMM|nr:16S rRNA (cytosine(1402)-N(4))-methyltransferase RsmH [Candidatus Paraluminiphilus aquimaris]MCH1459172.1 16S rRNA (cytosine(1402)-N(4))-methyltransferase RsmH [Luminiphilus sp.]UZP75426.1 16S rRNA (cytosine(1402)-N(4))-methyltransferase RsmH [Candidatus Paraluminiphilus aquimaris]